MSHIQIHIFFIVFVTLFQFLFDKYNKKCLVEPKLFALLLVHHLINTFFTFGWIFDDKNILKIYVGMWIIIYIQFIIYKKCILTTYENKLCPNKPTKYFQDIFYWIGLKEHETGMFIIHVIRFIGLFIALYKLKK